MSGSRDDDRFVYNEAGWRRSKTWAELGFENVPDGPIIWEPPPEFALVRGKHYTEHVARIKQLKREERYKEALNLLKQCQAATLRSDVGRPAPWYFEQAAIIYRKLKMAAEERAVLELYLNSCEPGKASPQLRERLAKMDSTQAKGLGRA